MITLDEILSKCPPELVDACEHGAIAQIMSEGRTQIVTRLGGPGLVMDTLGPVGGAALLDTLETQAPNVPALRWALVLLKNGELNFGSEGTRVMIDQLLPLDAAAALKSLAVQPVKVTVQEVIDAMAGGK
jgi:hypothetical protein